MFQVAVRGFNLPSPGAVGNVGACLFHANSPVERKGSPVGQCVSEDL